MHDWCLFKSLVRCPMLPYPCRWGKWRWIWRMIWRWKWIELRRLIVVGREFDVCWSSGWNRQGGAMIWMTPGGTMSVLLQEKGTDYRLGHQPAKTNRRRMVVFQWLFNYHRGWTCPKTRKKRTSSLPFPSGSRFLSLLVEWLNNDYDFWMYVRQEDMFFQLTCKSITYGPSTIREKENSIQTNF